MWTGRFETLALRWTTLEIWKSLCQRIRGNVNIFSKQKCIHQQRHWQSRKPSLSGYSFFSGMIKHGLQLTQSFGKLLSFDSWITQLSGNSENLSDNCPPFHTSTWSAFAPLHRFDNCIIASSTWYPRNETSTKCN